MPHTIKTTLKEEYSRLKKVVEKIVNPGKQSLPSLALLPLRNKKDLKNTGHH